MPSEAVITRMMDIFTEVIDLGGVEERTAIVPNLSVTDAAPTGLTGFVIVQDDRDGDNILAKTVPGVVYANNDKVNVLFVKGTEPIAFQQGSESSSSGIWGIVPSTLTDIFYNNGDVGIGKSVAPDASLEILDTAQAQLRLTHTEDTKFVDFTVDTNHDLTITPSSIGQVIFQSTTDSVDFFQVLDMDGGTPIFNVDATNERVGIGTAAPTVQFQIKSASLPAANVDVLSVLDSSGQVRSTIKNTGAQEWLLHSTGVESGRITYSTPATKPAILIFTGSPGAYINRFDIANEATFVSMRYSADTYGISILAGGNVGIGIDSPTAQLHIDQSSTTAAIPVTLFDQADVSEEMFEFATTIGTGNAIEAVGAKTLTVTHFIKVTLPGGLTRYLEVGTIA